MSDTLIDSYSEGNRNTQMSSYTNVNERVGQAVTLAANWNITSAKFFVQKISSPTGNIYAYLYASTGTVGTDAKTTGSPLATSDALALGDLTGQYQLIEFTFSTPYNASAGDICIMIGNDNGDSSNYLQVGCDDSSPTHGGNLCRIHAGTPGSVARDCCFYLYGLANGSGWTGKILGVTDPAKICGIAVANIAKVQGVA